jgi:hypothetical protein
MALVATLAHELGHVILLRPGLVKANEADMEPLNDLLTVFLGFGVFNANSVFQLVNAASRILIGTAVWLRTRSLRRGARGIETGMG